MKGNTSGLKFTTDKSHDFYAIDLYKTMQQGFPRVKPDETKIDPKSSLVHNFQRKGMRYQDKVNS